jgi:hypothetical protein
MTFDCIPCVNDERDEKHVIRKRRTLNEFKKKNGEHVVG